MINEEIQKYKLCVDKSHERCLRYGLKKGLIVSKTILVGDELKHKISENKWLIRVAKPFMDQLYDFVKGSDFFAILTDKDGYILNVVGDDDVLKKANQLKMIIGASMNEKDIGTNAMGTAIVEASPVQISGEEHFIEAYHGWTCSAAPISDENGNIIGSIDLTGHSSDVYSHTLGMVVAASKAIEMTMNLKKKNYILKENNALIKSLFDSIDEGVVLCSLDGEILSVNEKACDMFGYSEVDFMKFYMDEIIQNWNDIKEHYLNENDLFNEDVMINARKNKLYFNLSMYGIREKNLDKKMILMFKDIKKARKLANKILGRRAIYTFEKIIGKSPEFLEAIEFGKQISDSKSTILITGESGSGKEVFAQAIQNYGPRKNESFVAINCGAIPANLIESELFGYEEGAFTGAKKGGQIGKFEIADGGTIFLDEIGEMPLDMQTKLLRVIEEGSIIRVGGRHEIPINVRIIAATNKKLKEEVVKGNFRHDLYYRLNVIPLRLPSLRERKEDIPILIEYFMAKISHRINKKPLNISIWELNKLKNYTWPGNVRELENFIELSINKERIPIEFLDIEANIKDEFGINANNIELMSLEDVERKHIKEILWKTEFNMTKASKILGIGRNTLYRKIEKYKITCNARCFVENRCTKVEHCARMEHINER